jgi:hypothetical protein
MNKEQIIVDSYENYCKHFVGYDDIPKIDWFIQEIKNNKVFSERWGLKIEERELSLEERTKILISKSDNKKDFYDRNGRLIIEDELVLNESNIPTKLITITYNDKKIDSKQ